MSMIRMRDNVNTAVGSFISRIPHHCRNRLSGCEVKTNLADIKEHETQCVFRAVRCGGDEWLGCRKLVSLATFAEHGFMCFSNRSKDAAENTGERFAFSFINSLSEPWRGDGVVNYDGDIPLEPWHRQGCINYWKRPSKKNKKK